MSVSLQGEQRKTAIIAILLTCIGYALYNIGDAALKLMAMRFHITQIFFLNNLVILACMALYGWQKEGARAFRTGKPKLMLGRALLAQLVSVLTVLSLPHVSLTVFYTLVFTSPFWVALMSSWHLKDRLDPRQMGVIFFGFITVVAMLRPDSEVFNGWAIVVLFSAFLYSFQLVLVRQIGVGESRPFMIMCSSLMSIAWSSFFFLDHFVMPSFYECGLFLMMGITGSVGLLCVSYAFQTAPSATLVAPYHYTQIIWGALLGYFIFGERPTMEIMIGSMLIILSGLYLIRHERRRVRA